MVTSGESTVLQISGVLHLFWDDHITQICSRAKRQMGVLYCRFHHGCLPITLKLFYILIVKPLLEYAAPVWDPYLIEAIESVQICYQSMYKNMA